MEHKHTLEQYKKICSNRIATCGGILMFLGGIMILGSSIKIAPSYLNERAVDFYYGLLTGSVIACMIVAGFYIAKMLLNLRNEETMRAAYIKETDERQCAVWKNAAYTGWRVSSIALLLASLAAGYFSLPICVTLLCASAFSGLCVKIAYLIYDKIL